jgi:Family of unknown function (DUF6152)
MKLAALLVSSALALMSGAALAHHSFAMFDQDNPIELEGTVQEFKFTSPHSFILLRVKEQDGDVTVWNLEAGSPTALSREGWTAKTIKAGDEVRVTVEPLRSGAPGGAWNVNKIKYKDGQPIAVTP